MNPTQPARGLPRRSQSAAAVLFSLLIVSALPLAAQDAAPAPAPVPPLAPTPTSAPSSDEPVMLSKFTVSDESADRYRAADAISAVRVRAPLIDTPSSISVVTREMMDDLAPNRVFDVTKYVAGVQDGRGLQFQDRMIIRGFETQNGARTVDNFLQSADSDNVEESVIDRIEVTKGPNAILSPAGAPGGSLNVITKSPLYRTQRWFSAEVGLYDAQKAILDLSGPFSPGSAFAYRLVGSYQDSIRYWGSDDKLKGSAIAPMLSWRISDKTLLTVKAIIAEHWVFREPLFILSPDTTQDTYDPKLYPGIDPSGINGIQPWSHVGTHSQDYFATLTHEFNEHISLRAAANYRHYFENSDQDFLSTPGLSNRYDPRTGLLTQDYTWALQDASQPYNVTTNPYVSTYSPWIDPTSIPNRGQTQQTDRDTTNIQVDALFSYRLGSVSTQTVMGYAYSQQDQESDVKDPGPLPNINLYAPVAAYPVYPANLTAQNLATYKNTQLYINERLGFFNDTLYVTGGILRYDTRTTSRDGTKTAIDAVLDDSRNMWSASVLYKATKNVSLYATRSNNASPVIANNLPLWREGKQDEVGFKSEWFNQRLSFNAAWYTISQTNVTVPNPAYQTDPTQPQTLVSDMHNHGIEFEMMGALSNNFSIVASFTALKMRDSLDRMVRGVADNTATALLNYRFTDGGVKGLSLDLGVTYSGRRAGDVPDGNFTQLGIVKQVSFYLKPQYTTTFGANYVWNDRLSTRLVVDNFLDQKDYISIAGGRISGTGVTTQPGINVRLSATLHF